MAQEIDDNLFEEMFKALEKKGATLEAVPTAAQEELTGVLLSKPALTGVNRLNHQILMDGGEMRVITIFDCKEPALGADQVLSRVVFTGYKQNGQYHNAKSVRVLQPWQDVVVDAAWMSRQKVENGKACILKVQAPGVMYKMEPGLALRVERRDDEHRFSVIVMQWDTIGQPSQPIKIPVALPLAEWRADHTILYVALSIQAGRLRLHGWQWTNEEAKAIQKRKRLKRVE